MLRVLKTFFKQQLNAGSVRRITVAVLAVVGLFWITKNSYQEWQIMRMVSVIAEQLRQPTPSQHLPANTNDTRV